MYVSYDGSVIANRVPSEPFLINPFDGVLKPALYNILAVTEYYTLIDLNKVQGSLACVLSHVLFCGATGDGWLIENVKFDFP